MVCTGSIPSGLHEYSIILDTGARPKFFRKDQLTHFLKSQVAGVSKSTRFYNVYDKPLRIVGSIKPYVYNRRLTELVTFLVCKRLAVPVIP